MLVIKLDQTGVGCNDSSLTHYMLCIFTNTLSLLPFVIFSGYFYSLDQNGACMYCLTLSLDFTCRLNLVLCPHNMCSWAQAVHSSGPSTYSLLFSTVLYRMIISDEWCQAGVTSWTLVYVYITELQHTVHSHLHSPLCGLLLFGKVQSAKVSIPMSSWSGQRFLHLICSTENSEIVILYLMLVFTPSLLDL